MNEDTRNKVLFTFPVVVATHNRTLWEAIEPFVDYLDIACEKFIISLKQRDNGCATYNVSCVIDNEAMGNMGDFRRVAWANFRATHKGIVSPIAGIDFNKVVEDSYDLGMMERVEEVMRKPASDTAKAHSRSWSLMEKRRESTDWSKVWQKSPPKDELGVTKRYNHWINRKLKKQDKLQFFGSAKEADEYYKSLQGA